MPWNEPGGGRNQNPWGGNNNQQPPDLDELLKNLSSKINSLFGGGNQGGGDDGSIKGALAVLGVLLLLLYGWVSFYQVDQAERAVVLHLGKFHRIDGPGPHFLFWPFQSMEKVDVEEVRSYQHRALMLTEDTNVVEVEIVVQYQVLDPKSYLLRVSDPELALHHATESALRQAVGSKLMDFVLLEGREAIRNDVLTTLQEYLDRYDTGVLVRQVSVKQSQAPAAVQDAFDDVNRAKEDEDRSIKKAEAYANQVIPEARGRAQRQLEEAEAYKAEVVARAEGEAKRFTDLLTEYRKAPEVTRERLYLETMEAVYSSTTKVMVDAEGSNNLLYLPLDRLMERSGSSQQPVTFDNNDVDAVIKATRERVSDRLRNRREGR